ncbi:MAG: hypothetical protein RR075_02405 [Pygmaiobacter sp.]
MHESSRKTALCGILAALSAVMMFLGGLLPLATFTAPAIAGIFLLPLALDFGTKAGLLAYVAVSLISFFIVPDREISLIFIFLLGYYPIVKALLDKLHPRPVQWIAKVALFNAAIFSMYSIILFLFPIRAVVEEFSDSSLLFTVGLVLLANIAFVVYDLALVKVRLLYYYRLRPKLLKK